MSENNKLNELDNKLKNFQEKLDLQKLKKSTSKVTKIKIVENRNFLLQKYIEILQS